MAVPLKTVNLSVRHDVQSGKAERQRSVFRQRAQRISNTRNQASRLTDLGAGTGNGLATKPKQGRPSTRITWMAGSTLDLKLSKRHA